MRISVTCGLCTWSRRSAKRGGYRLDGSEVDHVESAARADVGNASAGDRSEPVRAGGENAADEVVGDLGGGHVEHRGDHS